jgi:predicted RND superfamily exporter protein
MSEPRTNKLAYAWIEWSLARPRRVLHLMIGSTLLAVLLAVLPTLLPGGLGPLPTIEVDVDPENMLEPDEPVRVFHDEAKRRFGLHDAVVVGIINERHPAGVFNARTLTYLYRLTEFAKGLDGVVAPDVLSLATVDRIENAGPGTVSFDWLMATPPRDDAEAAVIRTRAERIPFLRGTLFSDDGRAVVLYLPLERKAFAHDVSVALQRAIAQLDRGDDRFHIAGLPVAEETFGVEMFVQMAISAPLAMFVIFVLMWLFFRRVIVIVSPMIIAMVSVLTTMALLVVSGNPIHIMSSMIPIFIMPIAVLDSVHIISDFFDRYDATTDRKTLVASVMRHLFTPMLFTSLTTAAGFASLALTPIPPVRVFGIFVAVGVVIAWVWTILFVPAFLIMLPDRWLVGFGLRARRDDREPVRGVLAWLDRVTHRRARLILVATLIVLAGSVYGITRIQINDNPTRWFEADHPIRIADRELNAHFGGTYDAFLALEYAPEPYQVTRYAAALTAQLAELRVQIRDALASLEQTIVAEPPGDPAAIVERHEAALRAARTRATSPSLRAAADVGLDVLADAFDALEDVAAKDVPSWLAARVRERAAAIDATLVETSAAITVVEATSPAHAEAFRTALADRLGSVDGPIRRSVAAFLGTAAQADEVFKQPALLAYLEGLQRHLDTTGAVGKSSSLADIVKTVYRDLVSGDDVDYRIPATTSIVAQTLDQYLSSHRKDDLWHFVTPDYQHAMIWVQLTRGDNREMESVTAGVAQYLAAHPAPVKLAPAWFGLTHINVEWQHQMVSGMLKSFLGSFVVVLVMMIVLFRSVAWALLSMVPLTVTVAIIYGLVGILGKDYDMPVAVLSSLSLGLAIDYAIHFLARSRDLVHLHGSWDAARSTVFGEPARAISRNIVVVGVGFAPLLLAPLVPYQTVGILIASILLLAGAASLVLLPSLLVVLRRVMFGSRPPEP